MSITADTLTKANTYSMIFIYNKLSYQSSLDSL